MNNILIIAAHPDDEILGCAGTALKLKSEGYNIYTLILGEGVTSREKQRNRDSKIDEINQLKKEILRANNILGTTKVFSCEFPDNRFDTVPFLDIVKEIEKVKEIVKPSIIFTHFENDMNIDHQITAKAVKTATRPMQSEFVKEIYAFEILSSTEWNFPLKFSPNVFFDISSTIESKISAMNEYKSELRDFPHPRSLKGIELIAQQWGMKIGVPCAEAFELVRSIK